MKLRYADAGKFSDLRKRAQVFLTQNKDSTAAMSPEDIKNLVHELDTYQIELELHQVKSVPGGGSTFDIYLPKFTKEISGYENSVSQRTETKKYSSSGNERILVVDDEHLLVDIYKKQLEKKGYLVTTATDSGDALNIFREQPDGFDLLITDLAMPGLNGFELSHAVHQTRPDMPIIMCSGHRDLVSQEDIQVFGIKKFISKPLVREDLFAAVREILEENCGVS